MAATFWSPAHRHRVLGFLVLALGLAEVLRLTTHVAVVEGESMEPTLHPGETCVVSSLLPLRHHDLVVFHHQGELYVKRVMVILPDDSIMVLGDNRAHSTDSRDFGAVWPYEILGRVIYVH